MEKTEYSIWDKLEDDLPHFQSMARHARVNKRYAEAARLENMADYVQILLRYKQ